MAYDSLINEKKKHVNEQRKVVRKVANEKKKQIRI